MPPLKSPTQHFALTLTHSLLHEASPLKTQQAGREKSQTHISALNILRPPNPLDLIPTLLDRVNQRPDIAGHVVQQVDFRHPSRSCSFVPSPWLDRFTGDGKERLGKSRRWSGEVCRWAWRKTSGVGFESVSTKDLTVLQTAHSSYDHIEQGRALKGTMFSNMWDTMLQ